MNKLVVIITLLACLSACDTDSISDNTPSTPYTRVTTDQPDPSQYENTIHIVYAVPSGNEDKGRDKNYQLQQSILAADKWLQDISSGKQLRLDLQDNGDVDITYWAMAETNAELHQSLWGMRDTIEDKLKKTDWYNPNKLYVVYVEGSHFQTCGDGPTNGGHVVDYYLHNPDSNSELICNLDEFSTSDNVNGFNEYLFIHKVFFALGVSEFSIVINDLMYYPHWGNEETWIPKFVDFNNDDYFMHTEPNQIDILYSAFLLPNDGDELPPNWRDND